MKTKVEKSPLNTIERDLLRECETTINDGVESYIKVGCSLMTIRDQRLYRETDKTFEAYCQRRWNFTRRNANYLITAADTAKDLGSMLPKPVNARQAVALSESPSEKRREVWKDAVKSAPKDSNGHAKVTAAVVRRSVEKVTGSNGSHRESNKPKEPEKPSHPWDEYNAGVEEIIRDAKSLASKMRKVFEVEGQELHSKYAKRLSWSGTVNQINSLIRNLEGEGIVVTVDRGQVFTVNDQKKREAMRGRAA